MLLESVEFEEFKPLRIRRNIFRATAIPQTLGKIFKDFLDVVNDFIAGRAILVYDRAVGNNMINVHAKEVNIKASASIGK